MMKSDGWCEGGKDAGMVLELDGLWVVAGWGYDG